MDKKFTPEEIAKSLRVCAKSNHCEGCAARGHGFQYCDLLCNQAADLIEAQAKRIAELEEERRWIPVGERLPEDDRDVLVIVNGRMGNIRFDQAIEIAGFSVDEGWILEMWPEWENPAVTHWMPMPKGLETPRKE